MGMGPGRFVIIMFFTSNLRRTVNFGSLGLVNHKFYIYMCHCDPFEIN